MYYLFPELVDKSEITSCDPHTSSEFSDFITLARFNEKTQIGMIGDATVASREKGEKIVNKCVDRILEFIDKYYK
jgi:creatinine amidohydrolase